MFSPLVNIKGRASPSVQVMSGPPCCDCHVLVVLVGHVVPLYHTVMGLSIARGLFNGPKFMCWDFRIMEGIFASEPNPYHYEETHYGEYHEHEHHRRCTHVTEAGSAYRKPNVGGDSEYANDGNKWRLHRDTYNRNQNEIGDV